jgi:hypothetical protein
MGGGVTIKLEGIGNVEKAFAELADEIGDKKANSKVLVPAVREALKPVLAQAKMSAPIDTGALSNTLIIEARRPTKTDKRSKYSSPNDIVIGAITTKAFPKKIKAKFFKENENLYKIDKKGFKKKFKELTEQMNFPYDARAIAQEFGSANNPAHPYLRPALESQAQSTVNKLSEILARRITQFRAKMK